MTGEVAPYIVAETQARSRRAFRAHKSQKSIVLQSALEGTPSVASDLSGLSERGGFVGMPRQLTAQLLQIRSIVGGERSPTECWHEWHIRTMRLARALMHKHKIVRWSTHSLQMQWN